MRIVAFVLSAIAVSCGGPEPVKIEGKHAPSAKAPPKPLDESRRLPKANQLDTRLVEKELLGKPFMPGGTVGRYKKSGGEYEMFVGQLATANDAAFLLLDWKRELGQAHFLAAYGGYFGMDAGRPVFVFTKGAVDRGNHGTRGERCGCGGSCARGGIELASELDATHRVAASELCQPSSAYTIENVGRCFSSPRPRPSPSGA
jgi:hypothetical protein